MKINRSDKKTVSSSGPDTNNASIKKVEPHIAVDAPETSGASTPDTGGTGSQNPVTSVVGGFISSIRSGCRDFGSRIKGSVTASVTNGCEHVGSALNISTRAAALLLACSIGLGGTGLGVGLHEYNRMNTILRQEEFDDDDCAEEVNEMRVSSGMSDANASQMQHAYAAKAWSVCKALGLSDEQSAGVLGNMQRESQIDPTCMEGYYDEKYSMDGPVKSMAKSDLCEYCKNVVFGGYVESGWTIYGHTCASGCSYPDVTGEPGKSSINCSAYESSYTNHFAPGLGLFQYTGGNASGLLAYADSANKDWWDFDIQMAFAIDAEDGYSGANHGAAWLANWASQSASVGTGEAGVREAARQFAVNFEGNSGNVDDRAAFAMNWYNEFKGTEGDKAYGASILNLAGTVAGNAQSKSVANAIDECATATSAYGNGSIAEAAVAYAWESPEMAKNNDGTELYRKVNDMVCSMSLYQSCDLNVCTAVRWSGADDEFPTSAVANQYAYLVENSGLPTSDPNRQWESLGRLGTDIQKEDLLPGDVLISDGNHVVLYVGNELIQAKYPGHEGEIVAASHCSYADEDKTIANPDGRSPACEMYWDSEYETNSERPYDVFRNIKPESNSQYVNCVEGLNLNGKG